MAKVQIKSEKSVTSRIKTFVFKYISVAAKWVKTSGTYRFNIYTENFAYARAFNTGYDLSMIFMDVIAYYLKSLRRVREDMLK